MKKIYLAGGCFWGVQKYIDQFDGIKETTVGYANGFLENPFYPDVKRGVSGHAETVEVIYDETIISLDEILEKYYLIIDPTSLNKQGEDEGTSYRVGIYTLTDDDLKIAQESVRKLALTLDEPCVIEAEALKCFYKAEEYHQKYLEKNPNGYCHINSCFFRQNKGED